MQYQVEKIADDGNLCGEGPLWDWRRGRLIWNDVSSSLIFEYAPQDGSTKIISRGLMAAGMALMGSDEYLFAGSSGLTRWRGPDDYQTLVSRHNGRDLLCNDMVVDSRGRAYFGTLYWEGSKMIATGELLLVDNDGSARTVDDGVVLANGLALSLDETTLYFADSGRRQILAYDVDPARGTLSGRRVFVELAVEEGLPDGIVVDAAGYIWCAQWYGGEIVRYDPDGRAERRVAMPVPQVTSVELGGPDLTDLYVTTAAEPWPNEFLPHYRADRNPLGGALYRVRQEIAGRRRCVARVGAQPMHGAAARAGHGD